MRSYPKQRANGRLLRIRKFKRDGGFRGKENDLLNYDMLIKMITYLFQSFVPKSMVKSAYFKYSKYEKCVCSQIPQECVALCHPQDLLLSLRCQFSEIEGCENNQRNILDSQISGSQSQEG